MGGEHVEESGSARRLTLVAVVVIAIMIFNYSLIHIADTFVREEPVFSEEGVLRGNATIPANITAAFLELDNTYTALSLSGIGFFNVTGVFTKYSYAAELTPVNSTASLRVDRSEVFRVNSVSGAINYKYSLYRVVKPLSFLSIIAFLISLIGYGVATYLLLVVITTLPLRKRRKP